LKMGSERIFNKGMSSRLRAEFNRLMVEIFSIMPEPKMVTVHDNREVQEAEKLFGSEYVFYSSDYREIFRQYATAVKYVGSRIHGAIPCIISGATAHLIYTNNKAQVLEQGKRILSTYSTAMSKGIAVSYFGRERVDPETFRSQSLEGETLRAAIVREKLRIRDILNSQPILSTYTDIP